MHMTCPAQCQLRLPSNSERQGEDLDALYSMLCSSSHSDGESLAHLLADDFLTVFRALPVVSRQRSSQPQQIPAKTTAHAAEDTQQIALHLISPLYIPYLLHHHGGANGKRAAANVRTQTQQTLSKSCSDNMILLLFLAFSRFYPIYHLLPLHTDEAIN
ncbi:hypothetical protein XENOCAPTIV_025244 [Xenoophorus captivus]|uniref:Uncharacterized protein n=1 Tax=Xenoophorus captivus TaxID=1517983 RepID=A0ABV0RDG8_9TELE